MCVGAGPPALKAWRVPTAISLRVEGLGMEQCQSLAVVHQRSVLELGPCLSSVPVLGPRTQPGVLTDVL